VLFRSGPTGFDVFKTKEQMRIALRQKSISLRDIVKFRGKYEFGTSLSTDRMVDVFGYKVI